MYAIGPKMFPKCSWDQGEHVTYPQRGMICHRSVSNAIWNQFRKIVESSFSTSNSEVVKSQDFITSKFLVKKELFTIFLNYFQIALETLLWHIMSYCGYVTWSPWFKEHVENIFGPITCMKIFLWRKTRKDGSFRDLILTLKGICKYQKCCKIFFTIFWVLHACKFLRVSIELLLEVREF